MAEKEYGPQGVGVRVGVGLTAFEALWCCILGVQAETASGVGSQYLYRSKVGNQQGGKLPLLGGAWEVEI